MKKFFIVLICLISATAFAAHKKPVKKPVTDNDLGITAQDCQAVVAYKPSADVDYKPGVDVHGKPVMEADLTPAVVRPPEKYSFDLNVDAAHYLGLAVPPGSQGLMKVGTITIENGKVAFNGNPLEGDAEAALQAICMARTAKNPPK